MGLMEEQLMSAVHRELHIRIEEEADKIITEATARLRGELSTIVAGISLRLLKHVSFERMGNILRIEVDFPKEVKP